MNFFQSLILPRKHMGKDKEGVIFLVASNLFEMSDSYLQFIEDIWIVFLQ